MAVKSLKRSTLETGSVADNSMNAGYSFQDFHHLETIQLGATTASVSFINLDKYAGEYKHLQLRITGRDNRAINGPNNTVAQFNGDTGSNYAYHRMIGDGSTVSAYPNSSMTYLLLGAVSCNNDTSGAYGSTIVDFLDFSSTTKNKTVKIFSGIPITGGWVQVGSAVWLSTSAITSLVLSATVSSFVTGSRFSLYGIR